MYPEEKNLTDRTVRAVRLFHEIAQASDVNGWRPIFLSGFAIDAHFGYLTRNHRDVDICMPEADARKLAAHLAALGHEVYENPRSKGELLKVDRADPDNSSQTYCDIHFSLEEDGKVTIPLHGKKLVLNGSSADIAHERELLGEKVLVLKPAYLLEEKKGWCDQVGLAAVPMEEERLAAHRADLDKISFLLKKGL